MAAKSARGDDLKIITKNQVSQHNRKNDLWTIVHNYIYDLSSYVEDHPGGIPILLETSGQDSTEAFEDIGHSADAREIMEGFLIGILPEEEQGHSSIKKATEVVPVSVYQQYEDIDRDAGHMRSALLAASFSLLITGSVIFMGARYINYLRSLHVASGFWKGFGISSIATITAVFTGTTLIRKTIAKDNGSRPVYPAHYKPKVNVPKPTNVGILDPREFQSFPLVEKKRLSADTYQYVFGLPAKDAVLGLPTGQHVSIRHRNDKGEMISRSYTPTSSNGDRGRMELVVKTYEHGFMSQYLASLQVNDKAEFKGPLGRMKYTRYLTDEIGMIAGGTGITPMYSMIKAICENEKDETRISLLYANKTEGDILLRKELDALAQRAPQKLKLHYVLDQPPDQWGGLTGHIDKAKAQKYLPAPNGDLAKVLLCGPPGLQSAMKDALIEIGFKKPGAVTKASDEIFLF